MILALIFKYKKRLKFENLDDFCLSFRACFGKPAHMLLETTFVLETHLHFFGGQFGPSKVEHFFIKINTDVIRYCKEKGVKMDIVKQLTSMIEKEDLEET